MYFFKLSLDIWDSTPRSTVAQRRGVIGFTSPPLGSICGPNKYTVIEFNGFSMVQNAAHELGHS
jgi:hypothetical protein